jgi:hypothetical protein
MMNFIKDLAQAMVMAVLVGGPIFFYLLFMMEP